MLLLTLISSVQLEAAERFLVDLQIEQKVLKINRISASKQFLPGE